MAASVARRGHQQALWAILALALPLFLPTTLGGASFLLSMGYKILKAQAGGSGTGEELIRAQSGADGSAPFLRTICVMLAAWAEGGRARLLPRPRPGLLWGPRTGHCGCRRHCGSAKHKIPPACQASGT